jgi:hypothetical protein
MFVRWHLGVRAEGILISYYLESCWEKGLDAIRRIVFVSMNGLYDVDRCFRRVLGVVNGLYDVDRCFRSGADD